MKKRNVVAGGVVLAILGSFLAFMGGGLFGTGDGEGTGTGEGDPAASVSVATNPSDKPNVDPVADETAGVVDVVIDETRFMVLQPNNERKAVELADLIALIEQAEGNADGKKVRIARKDTSALNTERELADALNAAKIPETAIRWIQQPVK